MADIVRLPQLNDMQQLMCDQCEQTALELFMKKDKSLEALAFKCLSCGFIGYYAISEEGEE
jgi:RNase P subunit RPR2